MKRKPKPKRTYRPNLPNRLENPLPAGCDRTRRRFLRQLTAGAGAFFLAGIPGVSQSQETRVNFYRLDEHPNVETMRPIVDEESTDGITDPSEDQEPQEVADLIDEPPVEADPPPLESAVEVVEEQRALWIDDGYLVLIRWSRPERDRRSIAALEDAATVVREFLSASVTSVDQLHNLDRLHRIETELAGMLQRRVQPATIDVLHLDHDCSVVCNSLNPSRSFPEDVQVDGGMPFPDWE